MNRRYRKTIIAGNWKMNKNATETKKFAEELKAILPRAKWCDVVVCVPFVNIPLLSRLSRICAWQSAPRTVFLSPTAPTPARSPPICSGILA